MNCIMDDTKVVHVSLLFGLLLLFEWQFNIMRKKKQNIKDQDSMEKSRTLPF